MLAPVQVRAPQQDRTALFDPPWHSLPAAHAANRALWVDPFPAALGLPFGEFVTQARRELLTAARRYCHQSCESADRPGAGASPSIIMAGHQPEMFHPGVWFKNFALDALARDQQAIALNLIVDSDVLRSASLRVPGGSIEAPTQRAIPFDAPSLEMPYEARSIQNRGLWASFGQRVCNEIRALVPHPLIEQFWPLVQKQAEQTDNLGECLARARHQLERLWGLQTLEVPQSAICIQPSFCRFAWSLLQDLPRFRLAYEAAVAHYRNVYRVRSANHPVPNLKQRGEWLEAPFWLWRKEEGRRRPALTRRAGAELVLGDGETIEVRLPGRGHAEEGIAALIELAQQGICLRTRALVTTLWARLVLCDLFLHGIGGSKYDQVTDEIIRRYYGRPPPSYATITATVQLPLPRQRVEAGRRQALQRRLRDLEFHPETFLHFNKMPADQARRASQLVARKQAWLARPQTRENAKERCRSLREVNDALQAFVADERNACGKELDRVVERLAHENVLASREYSFVLHPEQSLRNFMLEISTAKP